MAAIVNYPNPRLHKPAKVVTDVHAPDVQAMIDDMLATLEAHPNAAAFAANQLDYAKPYRITVIHYDRHKHSPMVLVNPELSEHEGEQTEYEACMSVYPDQFGDEVKRAFRVRVKALDRDGKPIDFVAEEFLAKCVQHEVDHLDGMVYLQRLTPVRFKRLKQQIDKMRKERMRKK